MAVSKTEKQWRNTPRGYLNRVYGNIKTRCKDPKKKNYYGLPVLPWEDFAEWGMACPEFIEMHRLYMLSGKDRKIAPSVDRIDPKKGYTLKNIRWLTVSDNSKRVGKTVSIPIFSFQILWNRY